MSLLQGDGISLRTMRESDLEALYAIHKDISNRGSYFPTAVMSESAFRSKFAETGFWEPDSGILLIVDATDTVVGTIEFFATVPYLDELELSYHIHSTQHTGKGLATKAVRLMSGYLFDQKKNNRIRLVIHPDNLGSRRVAEKCGYVHEGTARGAWFHQGRNHDVEVFSLLREEYYGFSA